jgi:hypothetical protein
MQVWSDQGFTNCVCAVSKIATQEYKINKNKLYIVFMFFLENHRIRVSLEKCPKVHE